MSDLIFVALVVAFFAAAAGLVRACEHVIGPDEPATASSSSAAGSSADPVEAAGVR